MRRETVDAEALAVVREGWRQCRARLAQTEDDFYHEKAARAKDALHAEELRGQNIRLLDAFAALDSDCMTLALRLYGEDDATLAPETMEVMDRWRPRVAALLDCCALSEPGK